MVKISELKRFDMADHLDSEEAIADYLSMILEEDDPEAFIQALGTVARARSMKEIAEKTGLNRESLYKALSGDSSPRYETIAKVVGALGLKIAIVPQSAH
ncbi:putative addiction module antidote protein [Acinetobacter haemolyticus]|uniref:addiction module antidote protein n=1 Tax=Acinetobacter haemolyticus TaxID=29430 RepID=UPI000F74D296|nr:addiction module antidote protein [Acinetobacter haemolyticus]AZN68663.1 putative addiction module antidote protein [Acinetobacter haemolyticus]MQZ30303.1 putative addiction module antidote protein [Acinetobacter haemolyticus]